MADGVAITAGAGTTIATDDIAGVHYQQVKLVDGTLDSTAAIPGSATDGLLVNLGANNDVTVTGTVTSNAGTNLNTSALAVETGGNLAAAATSLAILDDWDNAASDGASVSGDVAHSGVDAGEPVKIGMRAIAHGTNPTAVDAADRTDWLANRAGVPWVIGGHPNVVTVKHTTITTAVTDAAIITVGAGVKIVVTAFTITLDNASTVFPTVLMGFGTANTPTTTGVIAAHGGVPAGGGFSRGDGSGILGIGADNEDLRITTTGNATGNGLQVVVTYYTVES